MSQGPFSCISYCWTLLLTVAACSGLTASPYLIELGLSKSLMSLVFVAGEHLHDSPSLARVGLRSRHFRQVLSRD